MADEQALRALLRGLLSWEDAHVGFEKAVADVPQKLRGVRPGGTPHSLWQILEHLRLAQADILEFCVNAKYEEKKWPDDYWPADASPPSGRAWDRSIAQFLRDRRALEKLAAGASAEEALRLGREILFALDEDLRHAEDQERPDRETETELGAVRGVAASLAAVGLLEKEGRHHRLTEAGVEVARALEYEAMEELQEALHSVLSANEFTQRLIAFVRGRGGVDEEQFAPHIARVAGVRRVGERPRPLRGVRHGLCR